MTNTVVLTIESDDKSTTTEHANEDAAKMALIEYVLRNFLFDLDSDIEQVLLANFDRNAAIPAYPAYPHDKNYSDALIEHYFKETGERYTITNQSKKGTADV